MVSTLLAAELASPTPMCTNADVVHEQPPCASVKPAPVTAVAGRRR